MAAKVSSVREPRTSQTFVLVATHKADALLWTLKCNGRANRSPLYSVAVACAGPL